MTAEQPEHLCESCNMFGCPVIMKFPKTKGCDYGADVMRQIKASKKNKSRDFDEVCKELGI